MRPLNAKYAYGLIVAGSLAIAGMAAVLAFLPPSIEMHLIGFGFIAFAGVLMALGLYWYRYESFAWRALADHLGEELVYLEAINTTITDHYCAFTAKEIVSRSGGLVGALGLSELTTAEGIALAVAESHRAGVAEAIHGLADAGELFAQTVPLVDGRLVEISGHRAASRAGQEKVFVVRVRDVSAAQQALLREQSRTTASTAELAAWRARLDELPLPVWLRGEDLALVWVNRAAAAALDGSMAEVVGQQRELFANALGEDGRWLAEQAQLDGQARSDMAHAIVGGSRHYYSVTELPLGQPGAAFMGYAVDLTRLEEKEAELKRHVAGNAAVLERLGSAIAIYGADQRLSFHNQAFVELWGLDEAFLRTQPSFGEVLEELRVRRRIADQADFRRFKQEQQGLFTSLIEPQEELQHLPDGRMLRALAAPHPFGGLMFVYEDVSRRIELETSYNTLVAVQQETLNNLAEGLAVFGSDGKLKLFNPAYIRIWQLDAEEMASGPHASLVIDRLRPFFKVTDTEWPTLHEDMVAVALDRTARTGRLLRADGSVLDYVGTPLPDGAVLHSFLDITDSVRVEQALRESNDALEAADRLKSEFIANITYQLRTPLTAIMGFAEILNNQYFGAMNERQQDYCGNILEASQRLLTLINDILELSSLEAGHMHLERSDVKIAELVQAVASVVSDWARQEDLDLTVSCAEAIGTAPLDERRIRQALFNLLSNAIKFTPTGGRVELAAEKIGDELILTVKDNGIGIPPADQQRIFKRFERANVRTGQAGAGLGLSVVKSIVEMHGGRVEIQSAPNRGSTIRCILPLTVTVPQLMPALS